MNENKYFLINRGEIENRFDPLFYRKDFRDLENILNSKRWVRLHKHAKFSSETWNQVDYFGDTFPYVEIGEIDLTTGTIQNVSMKLKSEAPSRAKMVARSNDILISTTRPNRGAITQIPADKEILIASTGFAIIRETRLNIPQRLLFFLLKCSFSLSQMERRSTGGNYPAITQEELSKVLLPKINDTIEQNLLINKFEEAINTRKVKEENASALLSKIDSFLLGQLGITLPAQPLNIIENRIFKTNWQKLTGNRFDPKKYSQQSESLIACIENSKLRNVPLKSLVVHSVAGDWGLDEKEEVNPKLFSKCLVIRATEFDNNYNLNIENSRAKYRLISNTKLKKLDIKPQDFLLEKSGGSPDQPVGRISILENELLENNTIAYSNFIHKFRVNTDEVLPEFLFCFLKTIHNIKLTDVMQSQTNGIRNLIMREYWNQSIILPDKKKQKEIADTIYEMRAEAKQTEIDAQQGFEQTEKEIEKLILE